MLSTVALVPSAPILVPELTGGAATETEELRRAALSACAALGPAWTVLGAHATDGDLGPGTSGTFAPYGVDVRVALGPAPVQPPAADLALSALVAGWLRTTAAPNVRASVQLVAADSAPSRCARLGAALAHRLSTDPAPVGLLVVGDGASTLTAKAPGAFDERAPVVQAGIDAALGTADTAALAGLDPALCTELGVSGRVAWQVAAATCHTAGPGWSGRTLHTSAPYGVGYTVAVWQR